MKRKAIIIGGGPAGLTAAYELLKQSDIKPVIIEQSSYVGGLSKTVNYKGNRIDIGGHRFFSKSDKVIEWWLNILPINIEDAEKVNKIIYQNKAHIIDKNIIEKHISSGEKIMLLRNRSSSIYHRKKFFPYPLRFSVNTFSKLGIIRGVQIIFSYLYAKLFPVNPEITLEDFFINRFGKTLYRTFFKDYTEKVWGVEPKDLSSEWGKQRVKGVSLRKIFIDALRKLFLFKNKSFHSKTETSLIEHFLYPKLGPGQLWEEVASKIIDLGGEIHYDTRVTKINHDKNKISSVETLDVFGNIRVWEGDYFFSTMPVKDFIHALGSSVPRPVIEISQGLMYRDFITVGVLVDKKDFHLNEQYITKDNWIYIQDEKVKLGRIQIFNNWSPYLVSAADKMWLGLEYFCNEGDSLWNMSDADFINFSITELYKIGILEKGTPIVDATMLREIKAYPSYFGSFNQFSIIKDYLMHISNLYPIGRNGMHKYNNSDHSMLTAMASVDHILTGFPDKAAIWQINTEDEYQEIKK